MSSVSVVINITIAVLLFNFVGKTKMNLAVNYRLLRNVALIKTIEESRLNMKQKTILLPYDLAIKVCNFMNI